MMKRRTTKDYLTESFKELAERKSIAKITIADITNNCEYSQPTFYNHFKDKYDLITWIAKCNAREIVLEKNKDGKLDSIIKDFIESAENNKKLAENITKYAFSIRALRENIANAYIETICELIKERNNMETIPSKDYKVISLYFVGAVSLLGQWLVNGMPYPKTDLKEAIILAAPQAVKDYLA